MGYSEQGPATLTKPAKVLLIRVECLCGSAAAIIEGHYYPLCGSCGSRMVPARFTSDRRNGGAIAYVAVMMEEYDAAIEVASDAGPSGERATWEERNRREAEQRARHYTDDELRQVLQEVA